MRIKTTVLNSICRFVAVMVVLCILPTGAFASENKPVFAPGQNITTENFATIQKEMLNSINEQITDLQGCYSNVSAASSAFELQKVLANQKCADMPDKMNASGENMTKEKPAFAPGKNMTKEKTAFAPRENMTKEKTAFAPGQNITTENFATIQKEMLNSINEQITNFKGFYSNVSEASSASELQKVLTNQRCADMPDKMNMGSGKMPGLFDISKVENVTDDNYTDVQEEMVNNIGNMTERLNSQLDNTTDENMTTMLNERITNLENFSSKISSASSASELKNVVFTQMQTQATDSLEMEIEHLENMETDTENTTKENMSETLSSRLTDLKNLLEDVKGADSLEDLKEVMSSSNITLGMGPGMGDRDMMHNGGNCSMGPGSMPKNNTENSTEV